MLLTLSDSIIENAKWNEDLRFYWIGLRKLNNKLVWYKNNANITYSNWYNPFMGKIFAVCIYQFND